MRSAEARQLLAARGLSPKKSFGQNFLVSEDVTLTVARASVPDAEIGRADVLEIGSGLGALTEALLARARRVIAVERDRDMVPLLAERLAAWVEKGVLEIVETDAQKVDLATALGDRGGPRVLCGNLPYQITGPLLRLAVENAAQVDRVVFMVQQEVADRLSASPGTKDYGALTVFVRAVFDVERVADVPPNVFYPPPNVSSAVVALRRVEPPRATETETFRALVRGAFATRRKTLRNAWKASFADAGLLSRCAAEAGVSLDARGETLSVDAFARLATALDRAREG